MEFFEKNKIEWSETISELFPSGVPNSCKWNDIKDIINILNIVGKRNLNHMFYPNGGGLDLTGASESYEPNCIELHTGGLFDIIKPKELMFEKITGDNEWSYFRIETDNLLPSGIYEHTDSEYEELTELEPTKYVNRSVWDQNEYQGKPLPESARVISRYFKGAFVIFRKTSIYNQSSGTYDGRHSKMSAEEFKDYIEKAASMYGI